MDIRTKNQIDETFDEAAAVEEASASLVNEAEQQLADMRKKAEKMAKRVKPPETDKRYKIDRRTAYQTYGHLMAALDRMFDFKMEAKQRRKLDDVAFAGDAIFNIKQAVAYLDMICQHEFMCDAEDLAVYK